MKVFDDLIRDKEEVGALEVLEENNMDME